MADPNWRRCVQAVWAVTCGLGLAEVPCAAITWQPLAVEGGRAPNIAGEPAAEFFILNPPALNASTQAAFRADLDPSTLNQPDRIDSIWAGAPGQLQLVARQGSVAPGTAATFAGFEQEPLINAAGAVLLQATVTGPFAQENGLWLGAPGSLQLLARTGTPLPGLPHMIEDIDRLSLALGDGGLAAFFGDDVNGKQGVWAGTPGNLVVAAIEDGPVPAGSGLAAGTVFTSLPPAIEHPTVNAAGAIAFNMRVAGPSFSGDVLWAGAPGALQLIAREGQPAPGLPGFEFNVLRSPSLINNLGRVAFKAKLTGGDDSIWEGASGNLQLLVRSGDAAPVGTPGVVFDDLAAFDELRFNDAGQVAFRGSFDGPGVTLDNYRGLFLADADEVELVAREGSQAPGMPPGALFDDFDSYSLNNAGRIMFVGAVEGGGVAESQNEGLWAQNGAGDLELVVRSGDWVHPATGDVVRLADAAAPAAMKANGYGQISFFDVRSAPWVESERGTAWNDAGQVAFFASLDHPSIFDALFVASVGAPPTPGDFDLDGDVDGGDLLQWQRDNRTPAGVTAWRTHFGAIGAVAAGRPVPEPATLVVALSLLAILPRRWRC